MSRKRPMDGKVLYNHMWEEKAKDPLILLHHLSWCLVQIHHTELNFTSLTGTTSIQEVKPAMPRSQETGTVRAGFLGEKWSHPSPPGPMAADCAATLPWVGCCPSGGSPDRTVTYSPSSVFFFFLSVSLIWVSAAPFDLNISFQIKYKLIHCTFWSGSL